MSSDGYKANFCCNILQKPEKPFFPVLHRERRQDQSIDISSSTTSFAQLQLAEFLPSVLPLTLGNHPQNVVADGL